MATPRQQTHDVHAPPTSVVDHLLVVVPARDESQRIERTLESILAAAKAVRYRASCSIVVVADSCTDSTAAVATLRLSNPPHRVVVTDVGTAGGARRVGVDAGVADSSHDLNRVWLASTDADTVVPSDWLARHLDAAASGLDAVAGIVALTADTDLDERLEAAFASYYELEADGTHDHVHAANLGVRANAYVAAGGWGAMATGEDHDLWARLGAAGYLLGSTTELVVSTSARRVSRAPNGFAADIASLDRNMDAA